MKRVASRRPAGIAVVAVALLVQFIALSVAAPPARASCAPGRSPHDNTARYVATAANVSGVDGISSSILEYDPYYSAYNAAGTNSSVVLTKPDISQWAQLGWIVSQIDGGVVRREVLHGRAAPIKASPISSVWIIVFAGTGPLPVLGPPGANRVSVPTQYQAVEVDDQSGRVMTWFMR